MVWNIFYFSVSWECHDPNWRTHIFQRGRYTTNQLWKFRKSFDCFVNRLWLVVWIIFYFSIYWKSSSQLTDFHIFQRGWNHQPELKWTTLAMSNYQVQKSAARPRVASHDPAWQHWAQKMAMARCSVEPANSHGLPAFSLGNLHNYHGFPWVLLWDDRIFLEV